MKTPLVLSLLMLSVGCSAPHAARVRCEAHLVPINAPPARSADPVAGTTDPSAARRLAGVTGRARSATP